MKNLSLAINGVLAVAVAILFFLHFSGKGAASSTDSALTTPEKAVASGNSAVYYINSDSVLANYKLAIELEKKFESEKRRMENGFQAKAQEFQKMYEAAARDVQQYPELAQQMQAELQQREMQLGNEQQQIEGQLQMLGMKHNQEFNDAVSTFANEYAKDSDISYVLGMSPGNGLVYADTTLDITAKFIEGLNAAFDAEKQAETEAEVEGAE